VRFTPAQLSGFAARLSDARAAMDLRRREVCERCPDVRDPQQLYNYERGRRAPESLDADLAPPTTADAIAADAALSRAAKAQLLSAYRALTG
jgi:transcriptional regulator with XRE-family HTH domain